jgi:hypothetical protein
MIWSNPLRGFPSLSSISGHSKEKEVFTGEKESASLTPSELRGRLNVVESVQVNDIDHRAYHPCVVL